MAEIGWSVAPGAEGPKEPARPRTYGPYRVEQELGHGGGGVVFQARHPDGRAVALKTVLPLAGPLVRERLLREGELAARLAHPGMVALLDRGEQDEAPFLVFELIEGARTLDQALDGRDPLAGARLVLELSRAVAHAHGLGVVHRDLKPGNVLLDRAGRPRLIDFGVGAAEGLERLTASGAMVGTPTHMAPEQITGQREKQGPGCDVWALGAILYRALTGRTAFGQGRLSDLFAAILERPPPSPREAAPGVPEELDRVCRRALAKDIAERYADAGCFAEALERALAEAERAAAPRRAGGALQGRRFRVWLLGLPLAATAGLALWLGAPSRPLPGPATPGPAGASRPAEDPDAEAARLDGLGAAEAWLSRFPDHPRAGEVRARARGWALGRPLRVIPSPAGEVTDVLFLPDGSLVAAGGTGGGWARRWGQDGALRESWTLGGLPEALDAQSGILVAGGPTLGPVRLDPAGVVTSLGLPPCYDLALDPSGRRLALGWSKEVLVQELDGGALRRLPVQGETVLAVLFASPEVLLAGVEAGSLEYVTLQPSHVATWRTADWHQFDPRAVDDLPGCLAVHGERFAHGNRVGYLVVVELADELQTAGVRCSDPPLRNDDPFRVKAHAGAVRGLAFSPDGSRLYALARHPDRSGWDLGTWDPATGKLVREKVGGSGAPRALALSPAGDLLALAISDRIELWRVVP